MSTILSILEIIGMSLFLYVIFTTIIVLFVSGKILTDKQGLKIILNGLNIHDVSIIYCTSSIYFHRYGVKHIEITETPSFLFPYEIKDSGVVIRFSKTYKLLNKIKKTYSRN